jgi:hypothetical protein
MHGIVSEPSIELRRVRRDAVPGGRDTHPTRKTRLAEGRTPSKLQGGRTVSKTRSARMALFAEAVRPTKLRKVNRPKDMIAAD